MRATKEPTVAIVIKPLHMPLQAGVPDPAAMSPGQGCVAATLLPVPKP